MTTTARGTARDISQPPEPMELLELTFTVRLMGNLSHDDLLRLTEKVSDDIELHAVSSKKKIEKAIGRHTDAPIIVDYDW